MGQFLRGDPEKAGRAQAIIIQWRWALNEVFVKIPAGSVISGAPSSCVWNLVAAA
jgi:hypothetical protein